MQRSKVKNGSATAKALDYSLKRWVALTHYLYDSQVPIDNNLCENQIRPAALGRGNWLFAGSLRVGQRAAAVMSLIQSTKINGHDPYAYKDESLPGCQRKRIARSENCCRRTGNLSGNWYAMGMVKSPQKSSATENTTYQLHIALEDIDPLIWRRLWVPSNLSLVKLDRVIQAAMGWTNSHLHEFEIAGERYGHINDDWDQDERLLDERRRTIGALLAQMSLPLATYMTLVTTGGTSSWLKK